ncbi:hypothetical protein GGI26_003923 [Coemansia sp. RSA 1358]|nr:hypothetical protein BX070DRAFT_253481 [Coemansia spiralis]KAJ2621715.1 hypothetical protein GGI26_003923 [Coemansia sp. RSA 1358]
MTSADFDRWDHEAKDLEDNIRHLVAISAGASASRLCAVTLAAQRRLQQLTSLPDRVHFIQQARESMLKMASIMGTPKSINALAELAKVVESDSAVAKELAHTCLLRNQSNYDYNKMRTRGWKLFSTVYGKHAATVEAKLHSLYPDLAEVTIVDSYGRLLSETTYLNARDTELCAIGSLVPLNVPTQLKSHCIGASRLGATEAMVQTALRLAKLVCTKRP